VSIRLLRRLRAPCFALALVAAPASADPARPFCAGETISYIVATEAGGGYDTYARLIAPHLEKQLPGCRVVVRNVPGAGNIRGTNQLYQSAPDGLTIGTFNTGLVYAQIAGLEGVRFDLRKLSWIGKASADPRVFVAGSKSGLASVDDLRASAKLVRTATSGVGSASHNETLLLVRALAIPVQPVVGYEGKEAEMGVLRGEVGGMLGSYSSLRPFVENGFGRFLFHVGGAGIVDASIPDARGLGADPAAAAIFDLIESQAQLGRLTAGPPGVPDDRLAALRRAYLAALADPALRAEAERLQLPIVPLGGEEVAAWVERALGQPPEVAALLRQAATPK
jgi:tripartite-type tricarboxylate transporter receptor subunit TctC